MHAIIIQHFNVIVLTDSHVSLALHHWDFHKLMNSPKVCDLNAPLLSKPLILRDTIQRSLSKTHVLSF